MNIDASESIGFTETEAFFKRLRAKTKKDDEPKIDVKSLSAHDTRVEILKGLLENAIWMYESKFSPRDPAKDYNFMLQEVSDNLYEFSALRKKAPTQTELTYTNYEYLMTQDLDLEENRKYIRNKMYCFIHFIYQFHLGEKYGRDEEGRVKANGKVQREKQSNFENRKVKTNLKEED